MYVSRFWSLSLRRHLTRACYHAELVYITYFVSASLWLSSTLCTTTTTIHFSSGCPLQPRLAYSSPSVFANVLQSPGGRPKAFCYSSEKDFNSSWTAMTYKCQCMRTTLQSIAYNTTHLRWLHVRQISDRVINIISACRQWPCLVLQQSKLLQSPNATCSSRTYRPLNGKSLGYTPRSRLSSSNQSPIRYNSRDDGVCCIIFSTVEP